MGWKMARIAEWLLRNKIVSLLLVVWGLALFSVVTIKVFFAPVDVPTGTAAAYATLFGILGLALTPWGKISDWWRERKHETRPD